MGSRRASRGSAMLWEILNSCIHVDDPLTKTTNLNIVPVHAHCLIEVACFSYIKLPVTLQTVFRNGLRNMTKTSGCWLGLRNPPVLHPVEYLCRKTKSSKGSAVNILASDTTGRLQTALAAQGSLRSTMEVVLMLWQIFVHPVWCYRLICCRCHDHKASFYQKRILCLYEAFDDIVVTALCHTLRNWQDFWLRCCHDKYLFIGALADVNCVKVLLKRLRMYRNTSHVRKSSKLLVNVSVFLMFFYRWREFFPTQTQSKISSVDWCLWRTALIFTT